MSIALRATISLKRSFDPESWATFGNGPVPMGRSAGLIPSD